MQISKADATKYPKLNYYLKNDIPKLAGHKKIAAALLKFGQIKKATLPKVLNYGVGPMVKVVSLSGACGEFTPNIKSNDLRLHKSLVQAFEKSSGNKVLLMTVGGTLLHELAHWGDDQDGVDLAGEEGELFEKNVYKRGLHHCAFHHADLLKKGVVF